MRKKNWAAIFFGKLIFLFKKSIHTRRCSPVAIVGDDHVSLSQPRVGHFAQGWLILETGMKYLEEVKIFAKSCTLPREILPWKSEEGFPAWWEWSIGLFSWGLPQRVLVFFRVCPYPPFRNSYRAPCLLNCWYERSKPNLGSAFAPTHQGWTSYSIS